METFFSKAEKGDRWSEIFRSLRVLDQQVFDFAVIQIREEILFRDFYGWMRAMGRTLASAIFRPDRLGPLLIFNVLWRKRIPMALINQTDCGRITPASDWFYRRCHACFIRELNPVPQIALQDLSTPSGGKPQSNRRARKLISWIDPQCPKQVDMDKLRPISLGISPQAVDTMPSLPSPKKWDVFFAGDFTEKDMRHRLVREVREFAAARGLKVFISGRLPFSDYAKALAESRLCLSPPGMGWDCWRHYEAMAAYSVPLMPYPTILQYQPPRDGEHCFYFAPEPGGLTRCLEKTMAMPERLPAMAAAARELVLQHHTFPKLREYVIRETLEAHAKSKS